jgi:hypothetical protein
MNFKESADATRFESQNLTEFGAQAEKLPAMPLFILTYPAAITGC